MIQAQNLVRRYGDFVAVDNLSFEVDEGEIVGILGPNGAGKTTTLRMITGFLPPSSGRVTVYGKDLFAEPGAARRDIGYLPENVALYTEMRVGEYLSYRADLEGMSRADAKRAIGETTERCLLGDVSHQVIGTLSKGYRQRVGLATAILHNPRMLVLDEPTVGLDPKQIIAIRELIRDLGARHTLLLSTHILPEVELLCSRVFIIDRGRIVGQGSPESLRQAWLGSSELRVVLAGAPAEAIEAFQSLPQVLSVRSAESALNEEAAPTETAYRLEIDRGGDARAAAFQLAVAKGWTLLGLVEEKASLEDIFVRLTTGDNTQDEAPVVAEEVAS